MLEQEEVDIPLSYKKLYRFVLHQIKMHGDEMKHIEQNSTEYYLLNKLPQDYHDLQVKIEEWEAFKQILKDNWLPLAYID